MVVILGNFSITKKRHHQTSQSGATGVVLNGRIWVVGWFGNLSLETSNQLILVRESRCHHALKRHYFSLLGRALRVESQQLSVGACQRRLRLADPH